MLLKSHTLANKQMDLPANITSDKGQTSNLTRITSDFQVVVKNQEGSWKCLTVNSEMKVENLKDQLCVTSRNSAESDYFLTCKGKVLEDNCVLGDYNIFQNQIIDMSQRTRGGTKDPYGNIFVDITSEKFIERKFSENELPYWRQAKTGLNLQGKCRNEECVAHSKLVIYQFGVEDFDLVSDRRRAKCPMCAKKIVAKSCYMVECKYRLSGVIITPSNKAKCVEIDFQKVEQDYRFYDHVKIGTVKWKSLNVYVLGLDEEEYIDSKACVLCNVIIYDNAKEFRLLSNCKCHRIHNSCYEKMDEEDKQICIGCEEEKEDLYSVALTDDESF